MNKKQFIEITKSEVKEVSVSGIIQVLTKPSGRNPAKNLVELSDFYNRMNNDERQKIHEIISLAIDNSIFGFLCVIDGVRAIEDTAPFGKLKLSYVNNDVEIVLNDDDEYLHDIYKAQ